MFKTSILAAVALSLLAGCSTVKLSERDTSIVIAKDAERGKGVTGISNKFDLEGKIVAHMSFRWTEASKKAGFQEVRVDWFSGDKLISSVKNKVDMGASPHYVWFTAYGTALGVGKAHVDVYVEDVYVGRKDFEVVSKL